MSTAFTALVRVLANLGYGSRRQVQALIVHGAVTHADGLPLDALTPADWQRLRVHDAPIDPLPGLTLMQHKPTGYACSHDDVGPLVYALLPPRFRSRRPPLSSAGRLDRDTSGLLLLTDDGALLHRIISPRRHVPRCYRVQLAADLRGDEAQAFASGQLLLKGDDRPLLPARFEALGARAARLTLHEGRYHQVRRMFAALGNHVIGLHREAIGALTLGDLAPGAWRALDAGDLARVFAQSIPASPTDPAP